MTPESVTPTAAAVRRLATMLCAKEHADRPCLGALLGLPCRADNAEPCDGTATACLYGSGLRTAELGDLREALGLARTTQ